jgi:hypothetical protein
MKNLHFSSDQCKIDWPQWILYESCMNEELCALEVRMNICVLFQLQCLQTRYLLQTPKEHIQDCWPLDGLL